ncbi:hypothetical protein B0I10_10116 [Flavobacterium lacus]|uniref:Uncharacterized protein n=1 Tax=Flavobacterium lacus TaxID=1353778 RepID=A0A328WWU6_9FLAO|nr:hypothetical protein B0I10_10116 [Flavobacterium lacus]
MTGLFHDPEKGFDASKILKKNSKKFINYFLRLDYFMIQRRGLMLVKSLKLFSKVLRIFLCLKFSQANLEKF